MARLNPSNASTLKSHLMFQAEPIKWMPVYFSLRAATEVAPARRVPFCGVPLTVCQPAASTDGQGTAPPGCTRTSTSTVLEVIEALQCLYLLSWEGHADGGQQVSMSPAADQNQTS